MKIQITPITQRAKNRVHEHGSIFKLLRTQENGTILVEYLEKTWHGQLWLGWFTKNEMTFEEV